jgi:drug/metabolite transporter (DMT)-like permease
MRLSPRHLVMLALITLFWGLNWPVMKLGVAQFGPMTFRAMSMAGGLLVLYLLIRRQGESLAVAREFWVELAFIALTNLVLWYVFAMYGIAQLASGRAAILGYTLPIWTALWGIALFGDVAGRRLWAGVAAASLGVALLLSHEFAQIAGRPLGTISMLIAAASWGYGTHLMKRRRQPTHVLVITFWSLVASLATCAILASLFERATWDHLPDEVESGAIIYNAVLIFGFVQVWWFRLTTLLPPVASGLSVMLIPVVGVFSGMWLLDEQPSWEDYAALGCILVAISSVLLPSRSPSPTAKVSPST